VSTYLVAYANGDFEHLESSYTSPLSGTTRPLRIYGISGSFLTYRQLLNAASSKPPRTTSSRPNTPWTSRQRLARSAFRCQPH
jgi:hypothetical protein